MYMEIWQIILGAFVVACAYFSYRSGHKQGVMDGMDSTLILLEQGRYIRTARDSVGEIQIYRVPENVETRDIGELDQQIENET